MHTDTWIIPKETFFGAHEGRLPVRSGALVVRRAVHHDAALSLFGMPQASRHAVRDVRRGAAVHVPLARAAPRQIRHVAVVRAGTAQFLFGVRDRKVPTCRLIAARVHARRRRSKASSASVRRCTCSSGSKPPWHMLSDGLPKHDAYPPEWSAFGIEIPARPVREGFLSGSCACGRIHFEIDGRPLVMRHCHCSRCRHARGSAHATNLAYKLDSLRYTVGEELLVDFNLPGAQFFGTSFCGHCGGAMPRRSPARGWVVVPAGSLDSDPQMQPMLHQHVRSKAAWFDITDGVPQFAEAPP